MALHEAGESTGYVSMAKIIALSGGGIRAAVAAFRSAREYEVILLHVNYGQASASAEISALQGLLESLACGRLVRFDLPHVRQLELLGASLDGAIGSAGGGQSDAAVGTTPPDDTAGLPSVALRGLMPVIVSIGVQAALRCGATAVVTGIVTPAVGAPEGLPFATGESGRRREFLHTFDMMNEVALPPRSTVRVEAPLIDSSYVEVLRLGLRFDVPLDRTWSCDGGGPAACGRCEGCTARSDAFLAARISDPLVVSGSV